MYIIFTNYSTIYDINLLYIERERRSVLRRQSRERNRNIKWSVYCQYGQYGFIFCFSLTKGQCSKTLDHTIRIGSTPTILYFDLYIYIDCIKYIDIIIIYQLSILSSLVPANSSMAFFNRSNGPSDFSFASLNCPNKESQDGGESS